MICGCCSEAVRTTTRSTSPSAISGRRVPTVTRSCGRCSRLARACTRWRCRTSAADHRAAAIAPPGRSRVSAVGDYLIWIDCEMTGLDLHADALIEVALLVTDAELTIVGDGVDLVIKPPQEALDTMPDVVRAMHTASGLLDELPTGITLAEAEQQLLTAVRHYIPEVRKAPLCGNSIATDRGFIARDLPELDDHLHYRMIDVSSIKELARRWYPRVYFASPAKKGGHRALADIRESIEELRYYREALFVPQPGPDTATARSIAASIGADEAAGTDASQP